MLSLGVEKLGFSTTNPSAPSCFPHPRVGLASVLFQRIVPPFQCQERCLLEQFYTINQCVCTQLCSRNRLKLCGKRPSGLSCLPGSPLSSGRGVATRVGNFGPVPTTGTPQGNAYISLLTNRFGRRANMFNPSQKQSLPPKGPPISRSINLWSYRQHLVPTTVTNVAPNFLSSSSAPDCETNHTPPQMRRLY